ncbi:DUF3008 family protein [Geminicoccus flavidas]|uniref:DUF3008 family protein n=1 Tax=Geminicoccus flavidas TaxID=2506407 RepID=UPI0013569E42|nr:DUF3008 family protein [Geminicoccus flavidas]
MPAKSKSQQMAAGAALSAKRRDRKVSEPGGPSRSMCEKELHPMAATRQKGKPEHHAKKS